MSETLIMNKSDMVNLKGEFTVTAGETGEIRDRITRLLESTTWDGARARRFRADWADQFAPGLTRLVETLEANAAFLEQERTNAMTAMD